MKGIHKLGLADKMVLMANLWAPADQLLEIVGPGAAEGYMSRNPFSYPRQNLTHRA